MMNLVQAIAREEGWGKAGDVPTRDHNPGDIDFGQFAQKHGCLHCDGRFADFPSDAAGFACMYDLLAEHYVGLTLTAALNKWAPPIENQTNSYIANVAGWMGVEPSHVLTLEDLGPRPITVPAANS